jgi:hypothetical protein
MSFKLPTYPSPRADVHELADYAEFVALIRGTCSARDVESYLGRLDDNDHNVGINDSDSENELLSEGMMLELSRRQQACGGGYPYSLSSSGTLLEKQFDEDEPRNWVYVSLLFSTRLNMATENVKAEIDGTKLLEHLAAFVLRRHLGADRARSMVFGTSARGSFPEKIRALCRDIMEGGDFRHIDPGSVDANDDRLDVVGWIPFSDQKPSKLSIFGQCKTGTSWEKAKTELQPLDFIKRWMSHPFVFDPVRAFFISESADRAHWSGTAIYTGLLFDRCRIVDFSDGMDSELMVDIKTWTQAAIDGLKGSSWLCE